MWKRVVLSLCALLTALLKRACGFNHTTFGRACGGMSTCGAAYTFDNQMASATISLLRAAATGRSNQHGSEKAR